MGATQSNLATKVDLKGKGIKNLEEDLKQPHMLGNFTKLQEICLAKNKISAIPNSYCQELLKAPQVAENLIKLDLHKNRLTEMPEPLYMLSIIPLPSYTISLYDHARLSSHSNKDLSSVVPHLFSLSPTRPRPVPLRHSRLPLLPPETI